MDNKQNTSENISLMEFMKHKIAITCICVFPYVTYLTIDSNPIGALFFFFLSMLTLTHVLAFYFVDVKWKAKVMDYFYYFFGVLGVLGFLLKPDGFLDTKRETINLQVLAEIENGRMEFEKASLFINRVCFRRTRVALEKPKVEDETLDWSDSIHTNCNYLKSKLKIINASSYDVFFEGKEFLRWPIEVPEFLTPELSENVSDKQVRLKRAIESVASMLELKRKFWNSHKKISLEYSAVYAVFLDYWAFILCISLSIKLAKTSREISFER